MDYITSQTPDKGVQIGPEPPISNGSMALTPDKGVQIGKELPIINASIALTPDKGVQIGPEPPISNDSIAMEPDKGVQIGPELPISNDSIAMTSDITPGFAGNLIEAGIVLNGTKRAVYKSTAYPANADGKQRPGAVVEYSSEFSVGEGFSVGGTKSELPAGYLRCDSIYSNGAARTKIPFAFSSEGHSLKVTTEHKNTSEEQFQGEFNNSLQMGIYNNNSFFINLGDGFALAGMTWGTFNKCTYGVENKTLTISANGKNRQTEKAIFANVADFTLFYGRGNYPGYKRSFILAVDNVILYDFKPSISPSGKVIWFNSVDKKEYPATSGVYTACFTLAQARKLGKHLPEGGGKLTISLPTGYEQDTAIAAALETARLKGWTLTIQTYTPEIVTEAASTFALRRIWVRKTQDEQGTYVNADGSRWQVDWCVDMITPDNSTPDAHGYEMFRNIEAATEYWGLTSWVDPEQEEEFLQEL